MDFWIRIVLMFIIILGVMLTCVSVGYDEGFEAGKKEALIKGEENARSS